MPAITQYIAANKEWLFPVIGVIGALLAWLIKSLRDRSRTGVSSSSTVTQNPSVVINNAVSVPSMAQQPYLPPTAAVQQSNKEKTTILFIDDDTEFKIVSMLKKAGWRRVSIIADVDRIDHEKIRAADIIFVDVHDVGKKLGFERQGLGLMMAIKQRYEDKKTVIYSSVPLHDIFGEELDYADKRLRKTSEFIEFENAIESLLK